MSKQIVPVGQNTAPHAVATDIGGQIPSDVLVRCDKDVAPQLISMGDYLTKEGYPKTKGLFNTPLPPYVGLTTLEDELISIYEAMRRVKKGSTTELRFRSPIASEGAITSEGEDYLYLKSDSTTLFGVGHHGSRFHTSGLETDSRQGALKWKHSLVSADSIAPLDTTTGLITLVADSTLQNTELTKMSHKIDIEKFQRLLKTKVVHKNNKIWFLPELNAVTIGEAANRLNNLASKQGWDKNDKVLVGQYLKNNALQCVAFRTETSFMVTKDHHRFKKAEGLMIRNEGLTRPQKPKYDRVPEEKQKRLVQLWERRFPIDSLCRVVVGRGFRLEEADIYKQSILLALIDTNWSKTKLFIGSFEAIGIGVSIPVHSLYEGTTANSGKSGFDFTSVSKKAIWFGDEVEDVHRDIGTDALAGVMKKSADGRVQTEIKHGFTTQMEIPAMMFLGAVSKKTELLNELALPELLTRLKVPILENTPAEEYFKEFKINGSNDPDVRIGLQWYLYDTITAYIALLEAMTYNERCAWFDSTVFPNLEDLEPLVRKNEDPVDYTLYRMASEFVGTSIHEFKRVPLPTEDDESYNELNRERALHTCGIGMYQKELVFFITAIKQRDTAPKLYMDYLGIKRNIKVMNAEIAIAESDTSVFNKLGTFFSASTSVVVPADSWLPALHIEGVDEPRAKTDKVKIVYALRLNRTSWEMPIDILAKGLLTSKDAIDAYERLDYRYFMRLKAGTGRLNTLIVKMMHASNSNDLIENAPIKENINETY